MTQVTVHAEEFKQLGAQVKSLDDPRLMRAMRKRLRTDLQPVGAEVVTAMAGASPHRGGLSGKVAAGRATVVLDLARGASLRLMSGGVRMTAIEKGAIRHPVFGHRKTWAMTSMQPDTGSKEFERHADTLAMAVMDELTTTVRQAIA